jgi:hypothetical protein
MSVINDLQKYLVTPCPNVLIMKQGDRMNPLSYKFNRMPPSHVRDRGPIP